MSTVPVELKLIDYQNHTETESACPDSTVNPNGVHIGPCLMVSTVAVAFSALQLANVLAAVYRRADLSSCGLRISANVRFSALPLFRSGSDGSRLFTSLGLSL